MAACVSSVTMYTVPSGSEPLFYFRGHPVRLHALLVLVQIAGMVAGAVFGVGRWEEWMAFRVEPGSAAFLMRPWAFVTHVLIQPVSPWFILQMVWLWQWGKILEENFGRGFLLRLYGVLTLALPAVLVVLSLLPGSGGYQLADPGLVHFPLFLAVAMLMPDAQWLFGWPFKYWAAALSAIFLLQYIAVRDLVNALLAVTAGVLTYVLMRRAGMVSRLGGIAETVRGALPERPKKSAGKVVGKGAGKRVVSPKLVPRAELKPEAPDVERVNALLDKIAASGMGSLSDAERADLQRASARLKEKP